MTLRRAIPAVLCTGAVWLLNTPVAVADNCGSPSDCFGASASAAVAAFGLLGLALLWWLLDSTPQTDSTAPASGEDRDQDLSPEPAGEGEDWWARTIGIVRNMAQAAHERAEVEPDQADQEPDNEASARNDIITRAMSWVTTSPKIAYNQRETHPNEYGTYRTDCSGFVSMAWGLSTQPDTSRLPDFATRIDPKDLQKGDILLNNTATDPNNRHVVIFEGWANEAKTYYWGIEHRPGGPERDKIPFPYYAKDTRGRSLEPEKYDPYRYNKLRGTAR